MSEGLRGQKVLYRCRVLLIDGEKLELVSGHPQKTTRTFHGEKARAVQELVYSACHY